MASLRQYLFLWQIPFIVVVLAGWVFGGAYLLRRSLLPLLPEMRRRITFWRCVLVCMLTGAAFTLTGGVVFMLVINTGAHLDADLSIAGAVLAVPAGAFMAALCVYAVFPLTFLRAVRAIAWPVGTSLLLAVVLGGGVTGLTWWTHQREWRQDVSVANILHVYRALAGYDRQELAMPGSLEVLRDSNYIKSRHLRSPLVPEREIGFFYRPTDLVSQNVPSRKLVACGILPPGVAALRAVLFANGESRLVSDNEFRLYLQRPENEDFAKAFRESGQP